MIDKEVQNLIKLLEYAVDDLSEWSVYHDDEISNEIYEITKLVEKIKEKTGLKKELENGK